MAIEIVDFPIKHGDFSIAMLIHQRVPSPTGGWEWSSIIFHDVFLDSHGTDDQKPRITT